MQNKRVRDIMVTKYKTLSPEQTVISAVQTLLEYRQSAAPVVDSNNQLVGILSEADCMRETLVEGYYNEGATLVKELMTPSPQSVSPESELSAVTETFLNHKRRFMPVVEADTLVGILDRHTILDTLVKERNNNKVA